MRRSITVLAALAWSILGASPVRAAADFAAASSKVFAYLDGKPQPGCAASVMRDGQVLWAEGFGYADLATKRKVGADTAFNIASISKQFTAFAILQLEAAGKLSLDDSVRKHVAELPDYAQPVTIRHLLHHTGGLRDYIALANLKGVVFADKLSEADALKQVARQKGADFVPGTEFVYSNTGYFLLSVVVERVSKQSMRDYAAEHIFGPLGMHATSIVDRYPLDMPALARGYAEGGKSVWKIEESAWEPTGDGQVHTTVRDLALWDQNLTVGRVGGRALAAKMLQTGVLNDGEKLDYAMGLMLGRHRGLQVVRHSGSWAGYRGNYVRFPEQGISVAVLCNWAQAKPRRDSMTLADIWLGDALKPADAFADQPSGENVKRQAKLAAADARPGLYANDIGAVIELSRGQNGLGISGEEFKAAIGTAQANVYPLRTDEGLSYVAFPARDRLVLDRDPHVYGLLEGAWKPKSLKPYFGRYVSDDAGIGFVVMQGKKGLVAKFGDEERSLSPVAPNRFHAEGTGLIEFRDDDGALLLSPYLRKVGFRKVD